MSNSPVLVTGATGFVASHLITELLKQGYHVRGTVTCLKDEKVQLLQQLCPEAKSNLDLVEADLLQAKCWEACLSGGIQYVYHVASPTISCHTSIDDPTVIDNAVQSTLNVFKACQMSGTVKKVVMTGSAFAIWNKNPKVPGYLSEVDWGNITTGGALEKSKIASEHAAWDFVNNLTKQDKFELAVLNPGFVLGPLLLKGDPCGATFVKAILDREMPMLPKFHAFVIDVRDLAKAHINAMSSSEASGCRHILVSNQLWYSDLAKIISKEFTPMGYHIPTTEIPNFLLKEPHILISL